MRSFKLPRRWLQRSEQSHARVPGSVQGILIGSDITSLRDMSLHRSAKRFHCAGHPSMALPVTLCFRSAPNNTTAAGSGVADGVNKNWLNAVGDPASGCAPLTATGRNQTAGDHRCRDNSSSAERLPALECGHQFALDLREAVLHLD